jgi:hypothetical protein
MSGPVRWAGYFRCPSAEASGPPGPIAHSHITVFQGGSHLTLISHPNAVTATIASAVLSAR